MSALPELTEIAVLEKRYSEHSEHTLGQAFCLLVERWKRGARDRETAFRLLFLSWFANTEPAWLTGLDDPDAGDWFAEVFDFMGGLNSNDPELLFMVAYMADLDAWACGNNELLWIERSRQCRSKYEKLGTQSLVPATFRGRGAYGEYFSHVLENTDVRDYFLGK